MIAVRASWSLKLGAQILGSVLLATLLFVDRGFVLSDVTLYYQWSNRILAGEIPYRDFFFDYPPLALPAILAPRLISGFAEITYGTYIVLLGATMASLSIGLAVTVRHILRRGSSLAKEEGWRGYLLLMLVALPLLLVRYDLWPILLTALALKATFKGRPMLAGIFLGLGIAAKLYPAVFLPAFVAYWLFEHGVGPTVRHIGGIGVAVVAGILPFVLVAGPSLLDTAAFQQQRGLQLETLAGGLIQLAGLTAPEGLRVVQETTHELRSDRVTAYLSVQSWIALACMAVAIAVGAVHQWMARRTARAFDVLGVVAGAVVLAFVLTNRALSPQHVFWVLPFAVVWRPALRWWLLLAIMLTLVVFPIAYGSLVAQEPLAVIILNMRNLVLVALAVLLLARFPGRNEQASATGSIP